MTAIIGVMGLFFAITGLVAVIVFIRAFVFIRLWNWFVVPFVAPYVAENPYLTYPIAIGLMLIISFVVPNTSQKDKNAITIIFLTPFLALLMGWIVHLFI